MSNQTSSSSDARRRRSRALAVVAAVAAAEALWLIAEFVFGMHLQAPAGNGAPQPMDIGPGTVAVASVVLSLIGWAVLATLERFTSRARGIWLALALVALVASLGMPLSGSGVAPADRVVLVLMHLSVAAVVVPVLFRTSHRDGPAVHPASRHLAREAA